MWSFHVFLGLFVLGGINSPPWNTEAYNIESKHYTSYRRERNSMFGFSVAEYRDRNQQGWVVVGAPQAQTNVKNVYRGGAVYKCHVAIDDECKQIVFDTQEHNVVKHKDPPNHMIQIDNKTMQWFGATVSTSYQDGGPILACAPRYVFFGVASGKSTMSHRGEPAFGTQRDPVGTCFMSDLKSPPREFSPCRTKRYGFHKQGSCQAGFAAALSKNGERLFVGAPGSWYWQGQMYSIPRRSPDYPYVPPWDQPYGVFAGQTFTQRTNNRDKVTFTKEGNDQEDDRYLGYSVVSGDFFGDGEPGTAVGAPRGDNLHGLVMLMTWNMTIVQNITGAQMGSYFGYALAAGDIDNDGLDDLIIGAPMYTVVDNPQMHFETGKVYIFYGKGPEKYDTFDERSGETNRGRFGMSLAYLGDIDHDGYGDFAVGAPYAGAEGRGAVYIYQGSSEGLLEKYSQVIYGEELTPRVETFGFSIAGGLDLDRNLYPDMVVGSYESDSAMFFRSRPVIKMVPLDTYVQFGSSDKLISLDDRSCVLSDNTSVTCLQMKTCFKYTGDGVLPKYDFNVQYALDTKNTKSPRMCFRDYEGKHLMNMTIRAKVNEPYCRTTMVYIVPNVRDKLTSLDAEMRMSLVDESRIDTGPRNPLLQLRPIMARTSSRKDSVSIRKNCGIDNICTPDLQLNCMTNITEYLMGSGDNIVLEVKVVNAFEDAFEAVFNLKIPPGIDYTKIERIDKAEIPVHCSPVKQGTNSTLKCDIGNPLPKDNIVKFNVILQPLIAHQEMSSYNFEVEVNSSNPEDVSTTHDNRKNLSIKIWVKTDLVIEGESRLKDVFYDPANYSSTNVTTQLEYGPGFTHNYTLHNGGPFTINEAEIFLVWPAATLAGDDLLYLLEQPETSGPIVCASANSNPLSLKLEQVRTWQNRYHSESKTHVEGARGGGYPPIPSYNDTDSGSNVHNGGGHGTSSGEGRRGTIKETTSNSTHKVTHGKDGELIVVEDEWKQTGGVITTSNVTTSVTETTYKQTGHSQHGYDETIRQHDGQNYEEISRLNKQANERRRQEEEEYARRHELEITEIERRRQEDIERRRQEEIERRRQEDIERRRQEDIERRRQQDIERRRQQDIERRRQDDIIYETDKIYGGNGGGLTHGVIGGTSGIRTDHISGDREETIRVSDIGINAKNFTSSKALNVFLTTLTRDSVGYDVFTENGKQYLRFLGRFRVSSDGREYVEFKDGSKFPLENRYGTHSIAADGSRSDIDRQFISLQGQVITDSNNKCFILLQDGRRFPLEGSFTYTEEHTYTGGGVASARQGGAAAFASTSEHHVAAEQDEEDLDYDYDYDNSRQTESSSNQGRDSAREFETHSTRTHEERKTYERTQGSRVYGRNEGHAALGDDPSNYREDSGFHKRGSRHRREGDVMSVQDFKKFEKKQHRLHKRQADPMYDDFGNRDVLSSLNDARTDEKSVVPMCKAAKCVSLRCTLGPLEKDQEVSISARYIVRGTTLKKIAAQEELKVSTQLIAQVTKLPTVGKPEKDVVKSHEIYTNLRPKAPEHDVGGVPLWVVVLSACAGVIILLLLIYLLHKCGFFKRNRPTDAPERQPLNRNGHFHGDDHL